MNEASTATRLFDQPAPLAVGTQLTGYEQAFATISAAQADFSKQRL